MISIPPERVSPIAKEIESAKQTWAIMFGFGAVLGTLIAFGMQHEPGHDAVATFIGRAFWAGLFLALGVRQYKVMRRANQAVKCATYPHVTWTLDGRRLLASTERGVAIPEASLKLSRRQATMLTAPSVTQ